MSRSTPCRSGCIRSWTCRWLAKSGCWRSYGFAAPPGSGGLSRSSGSFISMCATSMRNPSTPRSSQKRRTSSIAARTPGWRQLRSGCSLQVGVQVELAGRLVPLPHRAAGLARPVVGEGLAGPRVGPDVPVAPGVVARRARRAEPRDAGRTCGWGRSRRSRGCRARAPPRAAGRRSRGSPNTGSTSQWSATSNPWSSSGERKNGPTQTAVDAERAAEVVERRRSGPRGRRSRRRRRRGSSAGGSRTGRRRATSAAVTLPRARRSGAQASSSSCSPVSRATASGSSLIPSPGTIGNGQHAVGVQRQGRRPIEVVDVRRSRSCTRRAPCAGARRRAGGRRRARSAVFQPWPDELDAVVLRRPGDPALLADAADLGDVGLDDVERAARRARA